MTAAPALHHLVYVSRAAESVDVAGVEDIVASARSSNAGQDVTGALLYSGTHFAQVLEGPEDVLRRLAASIAKDRRHTAFRILLDKPIEKREFSAWAMAYVREVGLGDLVESVWAAPVVNAARARRLIDHLFSPSALRPQP